MAAKTQTRSHGNLREALVAAGIELLQDGGMAALTLRKCAASAGVSHAAPAHHFDRIEGLLTAIAARGYEKFTTVMLRHRDCAADNAHDHLLAICQGYLEFAEHNSALYGLMFDSCQVDFTDQELSVNSQYAFQILADCCAPYKDTDKGEFSLEMTVWSMLHGYSGLTKKANNGSPGHPASGVPFQQIFDRIVPTSCPQEYPQRSGR